MRKTLSIAASVCGIGLFLLSHAVQISNYLGVFQLPSDIKDALIVLASIPTFIAWGVLILGLFSAGYLIYDSGHHTLALGALRKRSFRVDPIIGIAIALVTVGLVLFAVRVSSLSAAYPVGTFLDVGGPAPETMPQLLPDDGGPVKWSRGFLLSASVGGPDGILIGGIQITGQNKSEEFVGPLNGYIRSEITGQQIPFLADDNGSRVPLDGWGVPAKNQFRITALFGKTISASEFLRDFGRMTFIFQYGAHVYTRRFSPEDLQMEIQRARAFLAPRVPESRVGVRRMPAKD
jgi:hypothetical protein